MTRAFCVGVLALLTAAAIPAVAQVAPATGAKTISPTPASTSPTVMSDDRTAQLLADWPQLARYAAANATLPAPAADENRIVFYGDSITDSWELAKYFPGKPYVNRGISGQTTPQMLVRFRQDVIGLKPRAVVILAGTNDVAQNTGPETLEQIEDNFTSMCELARANGIRVVLASILPVYAYPSRPGVVVVAKIAALNEWLREYSSTHGYVYLDYFSAMQDGRHGLPENLSADGVHPNASGYAVMTLLAVKAIAEASR